MSTAAKSPKKQPTLEPKGDVLTLPEAAAYLRLPEDAVLEAVRQQRLPARKVREEWRFLKSAIQEWLRVPEERDFLKTHFGALKDDPYLHEMLEQIYQERGRPMIEEG
jgi:excisionase family DNA binding protein